MPLTGPEIEELRRAKRRLESPSFAARAVDLLGKPIEKGLKLLPEPALRSIHEIVHKSLERALGAALSTLRDSAAEDPPIARDRLHKLVSASAGAVGGLFGLAGLAVELPVTTVVMLRSIADIARSEGHDLADPEVRLACLEVFALGSPSPDDDAVETGYYAVRGALAKIVSDAAEHVAHRGLASRGAPALVRLIDGIASRFGIVVQEKVALEMVPVVGAISGAVINTIFIDHFQNAARGHFLVRRLERKYGTDEVRSVFERL